jgi:hypothetical protein
MKYRTHSSKIPALEDTVTDNHVPVLPNVIYLASTKKSVNKPVSLKKPSMEHIIGYIHGHHNTQLTTLSTSEAGIGALKEIQKELDLAGEELLRVKEESGISFNADQAAEADVYFKESHRIETVLQAVENTPLIKIEPTIRNDNDHCMT